MTGYILGLCFLFTSITTLAQRLDSVEVNNDALLNTYEAAYFNTYFKTRGDSISFNNKHVLFLHSTHLSNKIEYFNEVESFKNESNGSRVQTNYYLLNAEERILFNGKYDVIIYYWRKFPLTPEVVRSIATKINSKE